MKKTPSKEEIEAENAKKDLLKQKAQHNTQGSKQLDLLTALLRKEFESKNKRRIQDNSDSDDNSDFED